jgi:beta-galactosidase
MIRVAAGGQIVTVPGVYEVRRPLGRMGAPYGQYLQDDVAAGRVQAKMYVFLTSWNLSRQQRRELLAATRGRLRVWCYAPGYHQEGRNVLGRDAGIDRIPDRVRQRPNAWAEPTERGKQLGLSIPFRRETAGHSAVRGGRCDAGRDVLATWPDGTAAVALRQTADGWSLFAGPPGLTSELLRLAARRAGVHLYTQTDCNVYANGPYLVLHAAEDGPWMIDTGRGSSCRLADGRSAGPNSRLRSDLRRHDWTLARTDWKDVCRLTNASLRNAVSCRSYRAVAGCGPGWRCGNIACTRVHEPRIVRPPALVR